MHYWNGWIRLILFLSLSIRFLIQLTIFGHAISKSLARRSVDISWILTINIVYCLFAIQIKFYPRGDESNASNKLTADRHAVFTSLRPKTDYGFQVRAKTSHGWGEYSPTIYKTTGQLQPGSGKNTQQQVQRKNGIKDDTGKNNCWFVARVQLNTF